MAKTVYLNTCCCVWLCVQFTVYAPSTPPPSPPPPFDQHTHTRTPNREQSRRHTVEHSVRASRQYASSHSTVTSWPPSLCYRAVDSAWTSFDPPPLLFWGHANIAFPPFRKTRTEKIVSTITHNCWSRPFCGRLIGGAVFVCVFVRVFVWQRRSAKTGNGYKSAISSAGESNLKVNITIREEPQKKLKTSKPDLLAADKGISIKRNHVVHIVQDLRRILF